MIKLMGLNAIIARKIIADKGINHPLWIDVIVFWLLRLWNVANAKFQIRDFLSD